VKCSELALVITVFQLHNASSALYHLNVDIHSISYSKSKYAYVHAICSHITTSQIIPTLHVAVAGGVHHGSHTSQHCGSDEYHDHSAGQLLVIISFCALSQTSQHISQAFHILSQLLNISISLNDIADIIVKFVKFILIY